MVRPIVFVTRHLPGDALQRLQPEFDLTVWADDLPPPRDALMREASAAHGLLTLLTDRIDDELLSQAPNLLIVSNMATGFDNVDVPSASRHGVLVTRTPGVLTETSADLAFALLMDAARRVSEGDRYVRAGLWRTWDPNAFLGVDVHGATLGIVGLGRIGTAVARRASGFGMRILYSSRARKPDAEANVGAEFVSLDQLLAESDFVSLHSALTPETRHIIGARQLACMKLTAILINTARGPLVDHDALYEALATKQIAAAGLDVTDPEPLPVTHPLLSLENVVVTPHIASASTVTRSKMASMAVDNLRTALRGEVPENAVNPEIADEWMRRVQEVLGD